MITLLFLFTFFLSAFSQTLTTTDALGETIVQVVTLDPAGLPTTQILQTLAPGVATTQAATLPPVPQGPVGQPPVTTGPAPPTVYQYTTVDADGDTVVLHDTYTPTYAPSVPPIATGTGTILDYSQWLSAVGTNTPSAFASSSVPWQPPTRCAALISAVFSCFLGGAYIVFL
ncbi:hypothetical protein BXZ70DRAFT_948921 [Cristinia sonorae]|uniref:Uncharacterized protein n=1 Tax=Cristinia sonorae TaxID=1940300 RepID=A0A8K0XML1_9AGAR|nr:hypothetical protein BXZ70DRAFT_948921 [Cristinia sonorae]